MKQFDLPDGGLEGLSSEELSSLLDKALDAFNSLGITKDSDPDDATLAEGERIAPLITQIQVAQTARSEAATARKDRALSLLDRVQPEAEPEPEAVEAEVLEGEVVVEELEPVAASVKPNPVRKAAGRGVEIKAPKPDRVAVLTAAADVPGYSNGQGLDDLNSVSEAMIARMRGIPQRNLGKMRHRYGVAVIRKDGFGDLTQANFANDDMALVYAATKETRLPGGSLVAAGGWCAPSETLYDLCAVEAVDGIVSIPEFQVNRGGIRFTEGPDFSTIYAACGFQQTEAQAIAGDCKECCEPTCPTFSEIRLDVIGICIKAPILTNAAYPELVRRYIEGALVAHQHKVNAYLLSVMAAAAGTPITAPYVNHGSTILTLNALEVQAAAIRQKYRMRQDASMEVIAPVWLKHFIRIDLTARTGVEWIGDPVSDAQINSWFSSRHMSVQWVYDWQEMVITGSTPTLPTNVTVLMYPAGTWGKGTTDVINMDAVYDSVGLEANTYTALFVEEGILAVQKCTETVAVTLPVCSSGRTGAADLDNCFGVVAP
jgi:hypothetical protein